MLDLTKMDIYVAEDQIDYYSPLRVLIDSTRSLDNIADEIRVSQGEAPLFNYDNHPDWPEIDDEDWYNFYVEIDGDEVKSFYFTDSGESYEKEIEITEDSKKMLMEIIVDYYGGKEAYEEAIEEYGY